MREMRVMLLLIGILACVFRLTIWGWSYYGVTLWLLTDGPSRLLNFWW
jgi:type IV secretory pathway TrbD component